MRSHTFKSFIVAQLDNFAIHFVENFRVRFFYTRQKVARSKVYLKWKKSNKAEKREIVSVCHFYILK